MPTKLWEGKVFVTNNGNFCYCQQMQEKKKPSVKPSQMQADLRFDYGLRLKDFGLKPLFQNSSEGKD